MCVFYARGLIHALLQNSSNRSIELELRKWGLRGEVIPESAYAPSSGSGSFEETKLAAMSTTSVYLLAIKLATVVE